MSDEKGSVKSIEKEENESEDPRFIFLNNITILSLNYRHDKWARMLTNEENVVKIKEFLNKPFPDLLIISENLNGQLVSLHEFPSSIKGKGMYFLKYNKEPIPKEQISNSMIIGDFSSSPLEQLNVIVEEVMIPILSNQRNHKLWPESVYNDINYQLQDFKNAICKAVGLINQRTTLPMPIGIDKLDKINVEILSGASINDPEFKQLMYAIETAVIQWTSQVNEIIEKDSDPAILQGNPLEPINELKFWYHRYENLKYIYHQLSQPCVQKMGKLLEITESCYLPAFKNMIRSVVAGVAEAQDISFHLKPLENHFLRFEQLDFKDILPAIYILMQAIGLCWARSDYFRTPSRLIVLLQKLGNKLINMCHNWLDPSSLLHLEIDEAFYKLEFASKALREFYVAYCDYRDNMEKYISGIITQSWNFPEKRIFEHINKYLDRIELVKNYFQTCQEYAKLEKVEIGGITGHSMSNQMNAIYKEFDDWKMNFSKSSYDIIDLNNDRFIIDNQKFRDKVYDWDRRFGAIIYRWFDNCDSAESAFSLIKMILFMLERPVILKEFQCCQSKIITLMHKDIETVKLIYDKQMDYINVYGQPDVEDNLPPLSGLIQWSHELQNHLSVILNGFNQIEFLFLKNKDIEFYKKKHEDMMKFLKEIETRSFEKWTKDIESVIKRKLQQPLILRSLNKFIDVNFDLVLAGILKEVKYLKTLNYDELPKVAVEIYEKSDMFYNYIRKLTKISDWYNRLKKLLLPIELSLVNRQLSNIDNQINEGESKMTWNSKESEEYINKLYSSIENLHNIVFICKNNITNIQKLIETWSKYPLFERKDSKNDALLYIEDKSERLNKRYSEIKSTGEKISAVLQKNAALFEADTSSEEWKDYIEYVDQIIRNGLFNAIKCSLSYLIENTDEKSVQAPLFEICMELVGQEIIFTPSIDISVFGNFLSIIYDLTVDIFNLAQNIPRIASYKDKKDYKQLMEEIDELNTMNELIYKRSQSIVEDIKDFSFAFKTYEFLWVSDKEAYLNYFLIHGHSPFKEDINEDAEYDLSSPTLDAFQAEIEEFEGHWKEFEAMDNYTILNGWLRIDVRRFRYGLLNIIKKWSLMFKVHLTDNLISSLNKLEYFLKDAERGLSQQAEEGDFNTLVNILQYLKAVKDRQEHTDAMFHPLQKTVELLQSYNQEISEETLTQLQELPEQWAKIKKKSNLVKQQLQPLLTKETSNIRCKYAEFEAKQIEYREKFLQSSIYFATCENPLEVCDELEKDITQLETEMQQLHTHAALFEISPPEFRQLSLCHKELDLLRNLWKYNLEVNNIFETWRKTPWMQVVVEDMDLECKKFIKEIRFMDKEIKGWNVYKDLEAKIKNMMIALRAVGELQNSAIRERHWFQLMTATKVKFVMNSSTLLADLLELNLHKHEEEVHQIVDKAVKEMAMEKTLNELNNTWQGIMLEYEIHQRTGCTLIKPSEFLIETLEENQVILQNMMTSKHNEFFLTSIIELQQKLSNADQIINLLFDIQRTWCNLESIFIGTEDIRIQLPQDTMRFDEVDQEFKYLLQELMKSKYVIKVTNQKGLYENLEKLKNELTHCEKALTQYLETKRLIFPRFYFVSSVDLLDILSNGNSPELVAKHLTKLFDSMSKLKFSPKNDNEEEISKFAEGMYSKDGEYVKLYEKCDCDGIVEIWLKRLLDNMRNTIRYYLTDAVLTYEDRPRESWIFDYPAQVALTASQIWWAAEVSLAFAKLEEGYENALKEYNKKQHQQLNALIGLLLGSLKSGDRQKIMTICTIDVHSRDVVAKMVSHKIESSTDFMWQSQLRHYWNEKKADCMANICDAEFQYAYEYLGNTTRLVITPLTDRCYITLTQSLHLFLGGAPAGPAGTGKTETTKDLGRALGCMVYVFNCSEQMDYRSCGNIYKGLAQTGAWGCFDEFNRISVEVLSVVAVQVKTVQDALRHKKIFFNFQGEDIHLESSIGIFITMNPGYAGRTELPENLKTLFRPCAMVVPDFDLICEIMLVAEGFIEAQILSQKFITLYSLCKELLSKQDHYDWGLRAIKSVLIVAGSLKRKDPEIPENQVLMRALRDFNTPKIVADDIPVFLGLISDLFPSLNVPRKRYLKFEETVKKAAIALKLQPEENFILKVVQLEELLKVRHSVFVVGSTGSGKTQVCKTLINTYKIQKLHPVSQNLNPKVVTNDELFGVINPFTREWKDGLFSIIMRNLANIPGDSPKWIILDGDIDPMWIESLNTVMDDNKVLTLASNERIPLTPSMRLVFEIASLQTATPATVSRAGILYLNPTDLGWNPYVTSWIEERKLQSEKTNLMILFEKYIPTCLEQTRIRFKKITPIVEINQIQMLCYLLDCLLSQFTTELSKEIYELYFVFACVWAFGACLYQDHITDYRVEFSKWWMNEFKTVKFPSSGTVFDFYIDQESKRFIPWTEKIPGFKLDSEQPLQNALVHTIETTRIYFFLDLLINKKHPIMLVGNTGSGKTVLMNEKLEDLSDNYIITKIPFNFYTSSEILQKVMEKNLEKKAGRNFGPPGTKHMIYFIDDINMPEVDNYGTVQPHTLIRQHLDYKHWYDRTKFTLKRIHNCQYVSCMNPTAGRFTINPRLQRHFCVFAVNYPNFESLIKIYHSILHQYLTDPFNKISSNVTKSVQTLITTAITLHQKISQTFFPTAFKFHYFFNLRDLSNIFQGLLFATADCLNNSTDLLQLWIHECRRVYRDKLVDESDMKQFDKIIFDIIKKTFQGEDINYENIEKEAPLYCHFTMGMTESKYMPVMDKDNLLKILLNSLNSYNEMHAAMNIVLFEDAMEHICRINRILQFPRGNALLVGVGGSGKQSLARLASFISGYDTFQIALRKGYGILDLKGDLAVLYEKSGIKNFEVMFLMTDSEVADEKFLVLINDLLSSGEIPGLFSDEDTENIISHFKNEVKSLGLIDTKEVCWKFFIERVRQKIKVVLSFSPVGTTLRVRSRKFPALINCTCIDWFHKWPQEALLSVSQKFLGEVKALPKDLKDTVSIFMSYVHTSVEEASKMFLINEHRYNYTTPKTFLEFIKLYGNLLQAKLNELCSNISRLENGLEKLLLTEKEVQKLHIILVEQRVQIKQKTEDTNHLLSIVASETEKVITEKKIAAEEKDKVEIIKAEVSKKKEDCENDLAKAEPAVIAAKEALNTLDKNNLTELKSFGSPPAGIDKVTAAVMILLSKDGHIPKDRSWKAAKAMMGRIDLFMERLITFDKENIHKNCLKAIYPLVADKNFNPEIIKKKSFAAAGLCSWVLNILKYYEVFCEVEPKRIALSEAKAELEIAVEKYEQIEAKVTELEEKLNILKEKFQKATDEKLMIEKEAEKTNEKILLANRLINGLSSEKVRWAESIEIYKTQEKTLPGDVLLISAFVSYVGCFTKRYRIDLVEKHWLPFLQNLKDPIPISKNLDTLTLLKDDVTIAQWNNEGLPGDRMSTENATILINSERWPLMIDPQLQGIKWIKNKYGSELKILKLEEKGYLDKIETAVSGGCTMLIENIGENLDPVLNPLLGRNTIKKGKAIQLGDKEIEFHPDFHLILHTKLANPHYKPEMQAQTTLINFTVTRDGLEDQLLAKVVSKERPDLETKKAELTKQQNDFKITLKKLEDSVLYKLSTATGNILEDYELIKNLEITKTMVAEIKVKVELANKTEKDINIARELYRSVAIRAALLYFILNDLHKMNPIYQFSLKAFDIVFCKAIEKTEPNEDVKERVQNLIDSITYSVFMYTIRGLFEDDKIIFTTQMVFQILIINNEIDLVLLDFLLRFPSEPNSISPVEFLSHYSWGAIKILSNMDEFKNLDKEIEGSSKRWLKFVDSEAPEKEKFPQEWKNKSSLERLCIMRCLRPDRMIYAIMLFIEEKLGNKYVENRNIEFSKSFEESSPSTPVFFILSPGVDPLKDVESHGEKMGYTMDNKNFHNVSLGQGQEIIAENALNIASQEGHWVILQNIHLVQKWLSTLEKKLEQYSENSHENFRVFMSAEPASSPEIHIIPQGILESSIKITNEPPRGMFANLHRALDNFDQDILESCSKETEFKSILFSLCYFHAVVAERRKFGPQGWNRIYPFNFGDLTISVNVLQNYLENSNKVPWEDLRYLFGEIMYGGHITDDWDRRLCRTYLEEYMAPELLDGDLMYAPGIYCPPNLDYNGYHKYIDETIISESTHLYGLHPNAEIGFLTNASENLFKTLLELQPRDIGSGIGTATTREEQIKQILDEIMERLPSQFILTDIFTKAEDKTPYTVVAFQECERINILLNEIQNSLKELNLGLKGELTITAEMEDLGNCLFLDHVPEIWTKRAYPSVHGLTAWYIDLILRAKELESWINDFILPSSVWLSGFFNPQSFLTSIMQVTARKNELPLDKMCLQCEVTKKNREDFTSPPREGAYIHGLFMEGAKWNTSTNCIEEAKLKELYSQMPVIYIKAILSEKQETKNIYECPVYRTRERGPTYIWTFNLRTKINASKWIIGGVAILLQK